MNCEAAPTVIVAVTVFVVVSITDTELDAVFTTYTELPSGVTATPRGSVPTDIVAVTMFVDVSITYTQELAKSGM
jgi:hypothetical protein